MLNDTGLFKKYAYGDKWELQKLSFFELNALMQMAIVISKGKFHREYRDYYRGVVDEIRLHLDDRIQNKLFHTTYHGLNKQ